MARAMHIVGRSAEMLVVHKEASYVFSVFNKTS